MNPGSSRGEFLSERGSGASGSDAAADASHPAMSGTAPATREPGNRRHWIWWFFAIVSLTRLALCGDRDILALNQPYDDYWFVATAHRWIWKGPYDQLAFAQLQLYAIWLKAVSLLGIPARLCIDLLWLGASGYLAAATNRFCRQRWPGVLLFAFLALHPYSIALFDRALSENLAAALSAVAIAAMIDVWNFRTSVPGDGAARRRLRLSTFVASLAFAAAYHSRKEGVVLLAPLLFLSLWSLVHRHLWWNRSGPLLGLRLIVIPLFATLLAGAALAGANAWRWGVFARYELAEPGYVRAIGALNAIDPGASTPKWVTVTVRTRAKAYAVSPTFSELKPYLDGALGQQVAAHSAQFTGVPGEIGNGWFYWALRDAAAAAGWHTDAKRAATKYKAVSDELEAAFETGKLHRRPTLFAFVDPDWRKWLPDVPQALLAETGQVIDARAADLQLGLAEDATQGQRSAFTTIAGRRNPFADAHFAGWLIAPEHSRVALATEGSPRTWTYLEGATRPDVSGAYQFSLLAPPGSVPTRLVVQLPDGLNTSVELAQLKVGAVHTFAELQGVALGVDELATGSMPRRADAAISTLAYAWTIVGWLFLAAGVLASVIVGRTMAAEEPAARLIIFTAVIAIAARVLLLAILDSSSWGGVQTRYILPTLPPFAVIGVIGLWKLANLIRPHADRRAARLVGEAGEGRTMTVLRLVAKCIFCSGRSRLRAPAAPLPPRIARVGVPDAMISSMLIDVPQSDHVVVARK